MQGANTAAIVSTIAACVSAIMTIAAGEFAYMTRRSYTRGLAHDMRSEHDKLVIRLSPRFWRCIHSAYNDFREEHPHLPSDINDLVRSACAPPGLTRASDPIDYLPSNATPRQKAMWEFAALIYPQSTRGNRPELESRSIISKLEASEFIDARSSLGGFWDKWVTQLGPKRVSKVQVYRGQAILIILLTYLDITHRQWTGERNKGKGDMYRLAYLLKDYT